MKIDEKEKIYLGNMLVELCTDCNMNCQHCFLGSSKERTIIKEEFIDALVENVYGVDSLTLYGGEISLHPELVEMILKKFINKNIPINYVEFITNAKIKSEKLVEIFNWFRTNHAVNPQKCNISISADKFHTSYSANFTEQTLQENIEWYNSKCDDLVRIKRDFPALVLSGNAKYLKKNDVQEYEYVVIENFEKNKSNMLDYREKCNEKACGKQRYNCVRFLELHVDGYLYNSKNISPTLEERPLYNKTFSVGYILNDSLMNLVKNHNGICKNILSPQFIPVLSDNFSFCLSQWSFLIKKYVVELFNYTLKDNPTFIEKLSFNRIDNEIAELSKKCLVYYSQNKNSLIPSTQYLLKLILAETKKMETFIDETQKYKNKTITKSAYKLWASSFIKNNIAPKTDDDKRIAEMMDALYDWNLLKYKSLYLELYSKTSPYFNRLKTINVNK